MGFSLIPREEEYFKLFSQVTEKIQEASTALVEMLHDTSANFEAQYAPNGETAMRPAIEVTLIMQPLCFALMSGKSARMRRNGPK